MALVRGVNESSGHLVAKKHKNNSQNDVEAILSIQPYSNS